jgi:YfiH family protein
MQTVNLHDKLIIAYTETADGNMDERYSERSVTMANRRKFLNQFNLNPRLVIEGKQVHSDRILALNEENTKMWFGNNIPGVDGFITDQHDVGLLLKLADCVPVVIYDPVHGAQGIVHAGWKGTVKNIHLKALTMMAQKYQTKPSDCFVWLGPSAKACHFLSEQSPSQIEDPAWKPYIKKKKNVWLVDLTGYLSDTFHGVGVYKKNMLIDKHCTVETPSLFSHLRSTQTEEPEARFLVLAKLR